MKKTALVLCVYFCCLLFVGNLFAQDEVSAEINSISTADEMLRSNLHLQDQLHTALRAIERSRLDADTAAKQFAELFTEKMNMVEKSMAVQRERDLSTIVSMRESNRIVMIAAASLAGIGIIALMMTAYFQVRAMNLVVEIGDLVSSSFSVDSHRALGNGSTKVTAQLNSSEQANVRFLAAVEQLEKRIHELDGTDFGSKRLAGIEGLSFANPGNNSPESGGKIDDSPLGKGQLFLANGEPEKALACFDEALKLDPANPEAWVKKGSALESLRKLLEAIEAYDRAIAADGSLTVAYLYKGGVLNRMQRFAEAMECYERALGKHPKEAA